MNLILLKDNELLELKKELEESLHPLVLETLQEVIKEIEARAELYL